MNNLILSPSYWASVSGGKDSLYMLKLILENPTLYRLDGVVHFELDIDYPFIKNVIDYMESECTKRGIRFVRIKPRKSWDELYNMYGYPSRVGRWCNSKYKLDAKRQLEKFLKEQGCFLVNYIGLCADETTRFRYKETKDGIPLVIYPLVEHNIVEDSILEWAKEQPIFNDYYKYNRRCGCMCCPLSSLDNLAYTKKYYPNEYNYFMNLALEHEKQMAERYNKEQFSVWSSNSKYDTKYRMQRVDDILNGTYQRTKRKETKTMEELILVTEKFNTVSKKLNKELDGIVTAVRNGEKAGEKLAGHLSAIKNGELWKSGDDFVEIDGVECKRFEDVAKCLGIGTQHAYKLVKAYDLKYNEEILTERLAPYTLGKITEMIRVDVTDIIVLIDDEWVKPDMTLKQIRKAVDEYKKGDEDIDTKDAGDDIPEEHEEDGEEFDTTFKVSISGVEFIIEDTKLQKSITKLMEKAGLLSISE